MLSIAIVMYIGFAPFGVGFVLRAVLFLQTRWVIKLLLFPVLLALYPVVIGMLLAEYMGASNLLHGVLNYKQSRRRGK